MLRFRLIHIGALAFLSAAGATLRAQAAPKIELAFGYECGDRFIVKNDGAQPVLVEYAPAGSTDKSQLHLSGNQSAEIAMAQDGNLDLFVGGKLVATAPKGDRPCAGSGPTTSANQPASDTSVVRPPNLPSGTPQAPDSTTQADSSKSGPPAFSFLPPTDMVLGLPTPIIFYVYYPHPSVAPSGPVGESRAMTRRQPRR